MTKRFESAPDRQAGDPPRDATALALSHSLALLQALQNPDLYEHPVVAFHVIETHISWVLLTGPVAYKMKKPVCFGFLDFSTLSQRRHFCEEELRLNRRFSPALYQAVVPVTGSIAAPRLGGAGEPIEYLVKMRQFSQQDLLSHHAEMESLTAGHIDDMADLVADLHLKAGRTSDNAVFGSVNSISRWVEENFTQVLPCIRDRQRKEQLLELQSWTIQQRDNCRELMEKRKQQGFIRECHGDLHLGNMALVDGRVTLFDCIEFNPELRWIDVISEVAFVMMDLMDRRYHRYAWRFINRYLHHTGDYAGVGLLRYYLVYRAMVRAKVVALRIGQSTAGTGDPSRLWMEFETYLQLARTCASDVRPCLVLMYGLSGCGKSTLARQLSASFGAFHLRSDIERKRLFGLPALQRSGSEPAQGIYTADATRQTYTQLGQLSETLLNAGYPVIVDASFLHYRRRMEFRRLAKILSVPFVLVACHATEDTLRKRVMQRSRAGNDPSEATLTVLEKQLASHDPLTVDERGYAIAVNTEQPVSIQHLTGLLRKQISCSRQGLPVQ